MLLTWLPILSYGAPPPPPQPTAPFSASCSLLLAAKIHCSPLDPKVGCKPSTGRPSSVITTFGWKMQITRNKFCVNFSRQAHFLPGLVSENGHFQLVLRTSILQVQEDHRYVNVSRWQTCKARIQTDTHPHPHPPTHPYTHTHTHTHTYTDNVRRLRAQRKQSTDCQKQLVRPISK